MPEKPPVVKRILRGVLLTLLSALLILLFYVAVVMGQPQPDLTGSAARTTELQPLPQPLAAPVALESDKALSELAEVFPAPVMFAGSRALTFVSGECTDVPFEDGVARVVTLLYRTEDFDTLTVQSIYPARALSLLEKESRRLTGMTQDVMAGLKYVAMADAATLRMHAQGTEALYVLTTPLAESGVIDQWTNALQLYRPDAE